MYVSGFTDKPMKVREYFTFIHTSIYIVLSIICGNGQEVGAQIIEKHQYSETYTSLSREQKMKL